MRLCTAPRNLSLFLALRITPDTMGLRLFYRPLLSSFLYLFILLGPTDCLEAGSSAGGWAKPTLWVATNNQDGTSPFIVCLLIHCPLGSLRLKAFDQTFPQRFAPHPGTVQHKLDQRVLLSIF